MIETGNGFAQIWAEQRLGTVVLGRMGASPFLLRSWVCSVHDNVKENTMVYRVLPLFVVALALFLFASTPVVADDKDSDTHQGTVVSVTGNKLVMTDSAGKEHSHTVIQNAKVTIDGRDAKLDELKTGMKIKVTTPKNDKTRVTKIEAEKK